jgi:hypothetical protein
MPILNWIGMVHNHLEAAMSVFDSFIVFLCTVNSCYFNAEHGIIQIGTDMIFPPHIEASDTTIKMTINDEESMFYGFLIRFVHEDVSI